MKRIVGMGMGMGMGMAVAFTAASALAAQTPAPPDASEPATLTTRSTLVLVPALVRTKAGELVFTLKADDFILTDDGVPQHLTLEEDTGAEPLALVVDIEGGGEAVHQLEKYRTVGSMLEAVTGAVPHKVAVVAFDSSPELMQDFTPDLDAVATAIHDIDNGDKGAAILDSLAFSVDLLRKQPQQYRRAILLIGESVDRGSHVKLEEALRALGDTNTVIYSIGFSSAKSEFKPESLKALGDSDPGPPGGCMGKDPANPDQNKVAQVYDCLSLLAPPLRIAKAAYLAIVAGLHTNIPETAANLTGGEYFKLSDTRSVERAVQTVSNHLPNRYVLSFHPQAPHPGLHAIGLALKDYTNLTVNARNSYWADDSAIIPAQPAAPTQ